MKRIASILLFLFGAICVIDMFKDFRFIIFAIPSIGAAVLLWILANKGAEKRRERKAEEHQIETERKALEAEREAQERAYWNERNINKPYTFEPTGPLHECVFPSKKIKDRQYALALTRDGDPVSLQFFEWQGDRAIAVMNDRIGVDIGVARKNDDLPKLTDLLSQYDGRGEVLDTHYFEYKGEDYLGCKVRMQFFKRDKKA